MKLRITSDWHGNNKWYLECIKNSEHSLCLGDIDFDYNFLKDNKIDCNKHKLFLGNHDNYDKLDQVKDYNLGNYGPITCFPCQTKMFFVRGAYSIDRHCRTMGIDWWPEEEIPYSEMQQILIDYKKYKPEAMFSHDCPLFLYENYFFGKTQTIRTRTNMLLDALWKIHKPKLWYFGHLHVNFNEIIDGCEFTCIASDKNLLKKQRYVDLTLN